MFSFVEAERGQGQKQKKVIETDSKRGQICAGQNNLEEQMGDAIMCVIKVE